MMHSAIFFLLIHIACASFSSKFPFLDLPGNDAFMKPFKIISMEIKCQSDASDNGPNVQINIDRGRLGKFVEKERLEYGHLLVTHYVDKYYSQFRLLPGLKMVQPEAPNCAFINWQLMIEENDGCRTVNAILRNIPVGKEDMTATVAWLHRIMVSLPSAEGAKWSGTYFPNSKFLFALNMRFPFIIDGKVIIEPENYVPMLTELQKMPQVTGENYFAENKKIVNRSQKTPVVNGLQPFPKAPKIGFLV